MRQNRLPFNIEYLSNKNQRIAGLLPVKVLDIYNVEGDFHEQGLYSNIIFGRVGTKERSNRHSFINLRCKVLHPKTYSELSRIGSLYVGILQGKIYATWDAKIKNFVKSDILDGYTGFSFFMQHFKEIDFATNKSYRRALRLDVLDKYRDVSDIHFFIVMPAGLRDIVINEAGRPVEDEINKLYRKIIQSSSNIPDSLAFKEDPTLDRVRWTIQNAVNEVYDNIMVMLGGKKGFLQGKWGTRTVVHGTRNVISAMDPGCEDLESKRSFDNSTTLIGLYQMLRGAEPLVTLHAMENGIARDFIENIDSVVSLIDPKTLKSVRVKVHEKERITWGTVEGRADLISRYHENGNRHKPITIDGYYLKLIYQDAHGYRIINDIDEVPKHIDRSKIRPLSLAEYFYLTIESMVDRIKAHITRYPITGIQSTYPTNLYLKTTVKTLQPYPLDENFERIPGSERLLEFPDTLNNSAFFDTLAPHVSQLKNLGADFDGDSGCAYNYVRFL